MRKIKFSVYIMGVIALLGTGLGQAQELNAELNADVRTETSVQRVANLSGEVQIQEAEDVITRAQNLSKRVSDMLAEARKESDIILITCLNDKLTQINANLRNAQKRLKALKEATDPSSRSHEYTVIMVLDQKFKTLDQEASQCLGQDIYELGATQVTTEIDPDAVPEDELPTKTPDLLPGIIDLPKVASGTY